MSPLGCAGLVIKQQPPGKYWSRWERKGHSVLRGIQWCESSNDANKTYLFLHESLVFECVRASVMHKLMCLWRIFVRSYCFFLWVFWVSSLISAAYWWSGQVCTYMIVSYTLSYASPYTNTQKQTHTQVHCASPFSVCASVYESQCCWGSFHRLHVSSGELFFLRSPSRSVVAGDWSPDPTSWGRSLSHAGIWQPIIKAFEVFI